MKINEETTVSEEQVLFNKLSYEDQELIIKIMKTLQPCELSCELEDEKKIPEKLDKYADVSGDLACEWTFGEKKLKDKINEIIDYLDYLKSKGE